MCNRSPCKPLQLLAREQPDAPAFMPFHKGSPAPPTTLVSSVLVSLACGHRSRAPVLLLIHASAPRIAPRCRPRAHTPAEGTGVRQHLLARTPSQAGEPVRPRLFPSYPCPATCPRARQPIAHSHVTTAPP
jgi:hypothetical protein